LDRSLARQATTADQISVILFLFNIKSLNSICEQLSEHFENNIEFFFTGQATEESAPSF
jgi:hypothetical protein